MAEHEERTSSEKAAGASDADLVLDLNFVPQWARKPPGDVRYADVDDRGGDRGRRGRRSGGGRSGGGRSGGGRPGGGYSGGGRDRSDRSRESRDRRPRRDDGGQRGERSGGPSGPAYEPQQDRGPAYPSGAPRRARPEREEYRPAVSPVNVRFLPEQQALVGLVRQVSATKRAYPLLDLAALLISKPGFCFVKLEVNPEIPDQALYQCKLCRILSVEREQLEAHVLSDHVGDYFEVEEVEGDAPAGTFVCIAKCGYSGALLGPPNHHSYGEKVRRMHASRFAHLDLNAYKDRIKLSHDPEDVERWKAEAARTVVYRLKKDAGVDGGADGEEGGDSMTQADAERYLREEVLPKVLVRTKRVVISEEVAHATKDLAIKRALRDEWQHESRFPLRLSFALRAAFKHKHLHVFKAGKGKGVNFVTAVPPVPLDPEVAISSIHDVLMYLHDHPGCTRPQMVDALLSGEDPESDAVKELLQPLHWLIDRGHIIEFFNGTLSVPLSRK